MRFTLLQCGIYFQAYRLCANSKQRIYKNTLFEKNTVGNYLSQTTQFNKLTSVFYASVLLLIMNFVITLSK